MRVLIDDAGKGLNSHVVNALITSIPIFPTGTRIVVIKSPYPVMIGNIGVVTKVNLSAKEKPQILLLLDKFKRKIKPQAVDLLMEKGIEIQFAPL